MNFAHTRRTGKRDESMVLTRSYESSAWKWAPPTVGIGTAIVKK